MKVCVEDYILYCRRDGDTIVLCKSSTKSRITPRRPRHACVDRCVVECRTPPPPLIRYSHLGLALTEMPFIMRGETDPSPAPFGFVFLSAHIKNETQH